MDTPEIAQPLVLTRAGLDRLVAVLIEDGYLVVGPTVRDGAIVLDELGSADDAACRLGRGHRARALPAAAAREDAAVFAHSAGPRSWKQFLHPPRRQLWSADADGGFRPAAAGRQPRYAFLGVRGCDLASIGILGRVLGEGAHPDGAFARTPAGPVRSRGELHRAGRGLLLRLDGDRPGAGPGYDLALTERIDDVGALVPGRGRHRRGCAHPRRGAAPRRVRGGAGRRAGRGQRGGAADGPGDARRRPAPR